MPPRPRIPLSLLAILFGGFALRVVGLDGSSLWLDELLQFHIARQPTTDFAAALKLGANMPLDYWLTRLLLLWGRSETWLRLPAAFWGVLSIALFYTLARRLLPQPVPLLSALLLALAPLAVRYSREMRPYSLLLCLTLLATLLFLEARRRPLLWIPYVLVLLTLLHTHLFGLTLPLIHILAWLIADGRLALRQRRLAPLIPGAAAFLAVAIFFFLSPFRPDYLLRFGRALVGGLSGPTAATTLVLRPSAQTFPSLARLLSILPYDLTGSWPLGLPALALTLLGIFSLRARPRLIAFLLLWLLLPSAIILYALAQRNQFYSVRYLLPAFPPLLLLIAAGLQDLFRRLSTTLLSLRPRSLLTTFVVLLLLATLLPALAKTLASDHENWRAATAYLRQLDLTDTPSTMLRAGPSTTLRASLIVAPVAAPYLDYYLPDATLADYTASDIAATAPYFRQVLILQSPFSPIDLQATPLLQSAEYLAYFDPLIALHRLSETTIRQFGAIAGNRGAVPPHLQHPSTPAQQGELRQLAQNARNANDWASAIAILNTLLPWQANDSGLWSELGLAYLQTGHPTTALHAFESAVARGPTNVWAYILLANTLRDLNRPTDALDRAQRAVELDPTLPNAWTALGYSQLALNDAPAALDSFARGLDLQPDPSAALSLHLGRASALAALQRPAEAAAAWRAVLDLNPPPPFATQACAQLANAHPACR